MTAEHLRHHIRDQPFRPFTLALADGRKIPVVHPDFIFVAPNGRLAHVYQPDFSYSTVDIFLVLSLDFGPPVESPPNPTANGT